MKKGKNITLLVGVCCVLTAVMLQMIESVIQYISTLAMDGAHRVHIGDVLSIVIIVLLLIIPIALLVRNIKNIAGKWLPIVSIITNGITLLGLLFFLLTPVVPQYIIYSRLGLINTYITVFIRFLENGGLLFILGYTSLIIGSALSLPNKKKP